MSENHTQIALIHKNNFGNEYFSKIDNKPINKNVLMPHDLIILKEFMIIIQKVYK